MSSFVLIMGKEDKYNKKNDEYNKILMENKKFLDDTLTQNSPMVSIVILNRNGAAFLKNFFRSFKENTIYKNYEFIAVDNGSTDKSISILKNESRLLPLKIIRNKENKNFSQGCNQGAMHAKGEYILLINNDTEPTYGWLNEMVKCALRTPKVGAIGPKILFPYSDKKESLLIQTTGMHLKKIRNKFCPRMVGYGYKPYDSRLNKEEERIIITGAVLLVKKDTYFEVGGLDENFNYGHEDLDFSLNLIKRGYVNIYCPTALVFHHLSGTQSKEILTSKQKRLEKNTRIFYEKWDEWLKEDYERNWYQKLLYINEISN